MVRCRQVAAPSPQSALFDHRWSLQRLRLPSAARHDLLTHPAEGVKSTALELHDLHGQASRQMKSRRVNSPGKKEVAARTIYLDDDTSMIDVQHRLIEGVE